MGQVRIIGGSFRGRKLQFPDVPGLRPTPDRVRETLFNWLAQDIVGAECLDVFAGSGALGFEALSRGAAAVTMLEQSGVIVKALKANQDLLELPQLTIYQAKVPSDLPLHVDQFQIVFLDPPFQEHLVESISQWLEASGWLKPGALIYIESQVQKTPLVLPLNWEMIKEKKAGNVCYGLAKRKTIP